MSNASQRRIERIETKLAHDKARLDSLEQNQSALYEQLDYTSNALDRNNLQRQIEALDKEIEAALADYEATENQLVEQQENNIPAQTSGSDPVANRPERGNTYIFHGPVGSVGNQGSQTNVAGTAGNQVERSPTSSAVSRLQVPTQLSIAEAKQFCAALISAFPEKPLLEQMVKRGLGIKLNLITQGNLNYGLTVDRLVEWAESQGRLPDLFAAAVQHNSENPKLKKLSHLWLPSS